MRSIKPGRGPSGMAAGMGVVGIVFGIFWTIMAFKMTRDSPFPLIGFFFPLFGVVFVIMGIVKVFYNVHNATAKDRFSTFDITTHAEEPDPLNEAFGRSRNEESSGPDKSISARLSKVEELRDQGLISEEEYLEQRERILSEI